jgi:N-acetylornithine carbamoyltransferase
VKHLIETTDWSDAEVKETLALARRLKEGGEPPMRLTGKALAMLFLNPSLRTRVSFIRAIEELGGSAVPLDAGKDTWKLATEDGVVMDRDEVEHIREAIPVLGRYADFLAVRAFGEMKSFDVDRKDLLIRKCAALSGVPFVNMESAMAHPCQAFADALAIQTLQRKNPKVVMTWTYHPKALPMAVPNSFLLIAARMGWDLTMVRPEGFDLAPETTAKVRELSAASGGSFTETDDRAAAFQGAAVVYAKSWGSMTAYGNPEGEREKKAPLKSWIVDAQAMQRTDDAIFLHCLPIRRNVEATDEVLDSNASKVTDLAENRLHVQKAIMALTMRADKTGEF